jgi:hypothetical protein
VLGLHPSILYKTDQGEVVFDPTIQLWDDPEMYAHILVPSSLDESQRKTFDPQRPQTTLSLNPDPLSRRDVRELLLARAAQRHSRFTMDVRGQRPMAVRTTGN